MSRLTTGIYLFLICFAIIGGNVHASTFSDTIIVKSSLPDSVISEQGSFVNGSDTTGECDVYLKNRSLLKNVRMVSLSDSSLVIMKDSVRRVINAADVMKIVFTAGAGFWKGALIGMGISVGVFTAIGALSGYPGLGIVYGLVTGLPVALLGGLIGAFADKDEVYYLTKMNTRNKIKRIRYIMSLHK